MSEDQSDGILRTDESCDTEGDSQTSNKPEMPEIEDTLADPVIESEIDVVGEEEGDPEFQMVMPAVTSSGEVLDSSLHTPTKESVQRERELLEEEEEEDPGNREKVYSSFPCQVIPETLTRLTRTPPDGEHLEVQKNKNGRLRIYVTDHYKKFSPYSTLTHKPCTVCNRLMKSGEMHLNFPADLDRRRIWANLLGFKYKDILRSKMGPVSFSIAAGPICTEHFAEECFRNHNFNKSAIEAFGVPVAISPDVKTTPSKKRVPWVCTICEFHSCSVVELQTHLLDHTEKMLMKKDNVPEVPEAGFMCPFCRKCTYGYKTITGYRRHLNAAPIHHCHLRRIYEFAKMNCRASELEPIEKWDNWTRRNVYVAYHGCEPPANEVVLTPSPTKSVYNPEERTRLVQDEDRRRKAVRSLAFVGKEGGTSVNDHNVMQRAVYLQVRRNLEHRKRYPCPEDELLEGEMLPGMEEDEFEVGEIAKKEEEPEEEEASKESSPQLPMGSEKRKSRRLASSVTNSPIKKVETSSNASCPTTPAKKKRKMSEEKTEEPEMKEEIDTQSQKERDERFAAMVQKRSQQAKRLMNAKNLGSSPKKPRKALAYQLVKGTGKVGESSRARTEDLEDEEDEGTTPSEQTPEPSTSSARRTSSRNTKRKSKTPTPPPQQQKTAKPVKEDPKEVKEPEERPLKSMLARGLATGVRFSMAKYHVPLEEFTSAGPLSGKSLSTGSIPTSSAAASSSTVTSSRSPIGAGSPGVGLFSRVHGVSHGAVQEKGPTKRPAVLGRRPLILSPRKRAPASSSSSSSSQHHFTHHESSPMITSYDEMNQVLIPAKEMNVELVEEVIDDQMFTAEDMAGTSSDVKPMMTLAEALELKGGMGGSVKDQELEEISKEMMKDSHYYRAMEDAIKCKTVTKMRADMRLSRHCIRQIEAARARARLFGEGSEDQYQILYSHDGAQVVPKSQLHQAPEDVHHQQ